MRSLLRFKLCLEQLDERLLVLSHTLGEPEFLGIGFGRRLRLFRFALSRKDEDVGLACGKQEVLGTRGWDHRASILKIKWVLCVCLVKR